MLTENPLHQDLDHILASTSSLWEKIRDRRIYITGGTGFFGCWLLESFAWACDRLELNARAVVLTRNPTAFQRKAPHLAAHPAIELHTGDVSSHEFPKGEFSYVIHAATESNAKSNAENPFYMVDTIVQGTRNVLELAIRCGAEGFLLTSSGAVYGKQPSLITHIPEDYTGSPDTMDPRWAYGEGKRMAEMLCSMYAEKYGLKTGIARCFAFVGPYLPLDIHFAVGNFIRDGLSGGPIQVGGDGTPYRSYLYAADLAIWLWTILFNGRSCYPYNVGSEKDLTIASLAREVAAVFTPTPEVRIAKQAPPDKAAERYVPAVTRAQVELGLKQQVDLSEAIKRTAKWYGQA